MQRGPDGSLLAQPTEGGDWFPVKNYRGSSGAFEADFGSTEAPAPAPVEHPVEAAKPAGKSRATWRRVEAIAASDKGDGSGVAIVDGRWVPAERVRKQGKEFYALMESQEPLKPQYDNSGVPRETSGSVPNRRLV